jgi:hypothetical protein
MEATGVLGVWIASTFLSLPESTLAPHAISVSPPKRAAIISFQSDKKKKHVKRTW